MPGGGLFLLWNGLSSSPTRSRFSLDSEDMSFSMVVYAFQHSIVPCSMHVRCSSLALFMASISSLNAVSCPSILIMK